MSSTIHEARRAAGSAGEGGLLSFGRGKAIPALGGGALLTEKGSELGRAVRAPGGGGRGFLRPCRAALQGIFFHPTLYGIPASIPALGIGEDLPYVAPGVVNRHDDLPPKRVRLDDARPRDPPVPVEVPLE